MTTEYLFIAIAFVVGFVLAVAYARFRQRDGRNRKRDRAPDINVLMQQMGEAGQPDELGAILLTGLADRFRGNAWIMYVRDDVEFHLLAARGMSSGGIETLRVHLEADPDLSKPSQITKVVQLGDGTEYALVTVTDERQTGIVAVSPAKVMSRTGTRQFVESVASHALARVEAMYLGNALKELATRDAVTRLHNQRYFLELFELEYNRSLRYQRSLAVLLCGIDGLADLNEREGRETGDIILRQVAQAYRGNLRYFDVVSRYGADTLAVLLPEAGASVASRVAERLLAAALKETSIDDLSIAIGIACINDTNSDFTTMLHAASDELHRARGKGGNRVCMSMD